MFHLQPCFVCRETSKVLMCFKPAPIFKTFSARLIYAFIAINTQILVIYKLKKLISKEHITCGKHARLKPKNL